MNTRMFENSIVQDNLKKLTLNDYQVIQPAVGFLACRDEEPESFRKRKSFWSTF